MPTMMRGLTGAATGMVAAAGLVLALPTGAVAKPAPARFFDYTAKDSPVVQDCDSAKSIAYKDNDKDVRLGVACYERYDDIFWVRDRKRDGHHVNVYWVLNPQRPPNAGHCHDYIGAKHHWTYCDFPGEKALPEGTRVTFQVLIQEGRKILDRGNQVTSPT